MSAGKLIGLTGKRHVGKTTAANILVDNGFRRIHAFDGGKAACRGYFEHLGADPETARRMTDGDLKDAPSDLLPGRATPRDFMEPFGRWMGVDMGVPWTLGAEIKRAMAMAPGAPLVAESMVYEADYFREAGGVIIRIVRPGSVGPEGASTDAFQATIDAEHTVINDGSVDELREKLLAII